MPLATLAYWLGLALFGGFCGILFWKLSTGGIALDQLLEGDLRDADSPGGYSSYISAARVQSLLVTLFTALFFLLQVLHDRTKLPELPGGLIGTLAGSQALYLGGKAQAILIGRFRDFLR